MATSKMIDMAARGDWLPGVSATMHHEAESSLHRPRSSQEEEAAERRKAGRTVLRMALGRHDCAELDPCPKHGVKPCSRHRRCSHLQHDDDMALALEGLQALGLADSGVLTRKCSTCHLVKAADKFPKERETCKSCLYGRSKAAREAGQA